MQTKRDPPGAGSRVPLAGEVRDVAELPTSVVLDSVSDLVVVVRVEPGPTFRMLTANRAYLAMLRHFGFDHQLADLEGKLFTDLTREFRFTDEVGAALLARYEAVARSKQEMRFEEETPTPRGTHYGEVTLTPILDAEQHCRLILYTTRDITERKNAEARLQHLQKLEAMGMLAGGIAHDFNNILAAIMAYTDVAVMESAGRPDVLESLEGVLQACSRAADLVRQILTFSRKQKQERTPTRLEPVLVEVQRLMRATLPSNVEITVRIAEDAGVVLADSGQIHQVLVNLCTNAAQAIGGGPGRVEIDLAPFAVDEGLAGRIPSLRAGPYLRVDVRDSGPGMAPETLARIFEPFFTTKGPGEGTGLGLSVVHGIVQDHDGAIDVRSEPGGGTEFRLFFPRYAPDLEEVAGEEARPLARGSGQHVLFVDDERALCDLGSSILTRLGYRVTAVTRPVEALSALRERPESFDLLVTDLTMPLMTGIELAKAALALHPTLPVMLTTGFSATWTVEAVRAIGLRDLIAKPYSIQSLAAAVERHVRGGAEPPG